MTVGSVFCHMVPVQITRRMQKRNILSKKRYKFLGSSVLVRVCRGAGVVNSTIYEGIIFGFQVISVPDFLKMICFIRREFPHH